MNARVKRVSLTWGVVIGLLLILATPLVVGAHAQAAPTLEVVSPADGATITANDIQVQLKVSDLNLDCAAFGRPDQPGVGEILAFVDGATIAQLTNFYCTDTFTIPGDGLAPGKHTLAFVLASSTHTPMMDTVKQVSIDFQPPQPTPLPTANYTGDPGITLTSPQDGATVPASFEIQVQPTNFAPTGALEGKTNVPGYGHYHVWVDAPEKPSSLANLALMPGTNNFTLDLSAWGEGQHTIHIEPAQNDHTMYDPATPVTFTVTVSGTATPAASPASAASSDGNAASETTVTMVDIAFQPDALTIPANTDVTVSLPNTGASLHNFSIDELGIDVDVSPGDTGSATINAPAGTYEYYCNVPGHKEAGMLGTLTVQ
jgi:plastocyanin